MSYEFENIESDIESEADIDDIWHIVVDRRQHIIRNRPNFFQLYDCKDFRDRFRLSKDVAWQVLERIRPRIQRKTTW